VRRRSPLSKERRTGASDPDQPRCDHCGDPLLVFFDAPVGTTCSRCLAPPVACKVCAVVMSRERAGRYDRCEKCWSDLLAAQPTKEAS